MPYNYWADYEKHLNALRKSQGIFEPGFATLGARQRTFEINKKSKDPMVANKASQEFFSFLSALEQQSRAVEQLARSSIAKLDVYIRNVKQFPQSGQHYNNLNGVVRDILKKSQILSRARTKAMGM